MTRLSLALALALILSVAPHARAVFEIEMPLAQLVKDSAVIAVVTLEQIDREAGKGTLKLERSLKGDPLPITIPIKLLASQQGGGEGSPRDMLDRVQDGVSLVLFLASLSEEEHQAFVYGNGSWFKLRGFGQRHQLKAVFVQGEPNLRKTFHGDDRELAELIEAHLAGRKELPELDASVHPELGPRLDETTPLPVPVAVASDQIEIGPAWQLKDDAKTVSPTGPGNYVLAVILLAAGLGLVLMLTRSSPGAAS